MDDSFQHVPVVGMDERTADPSSVVGTVVIIAGQ
jgi:hypothetical protein